MRTPPACLQDAHELFCGLLDLLQSEVLAREVRVLVPAFAHARCVAPATTPAHSWASPLLSTLGQLLFSTLGQPLRIAAQLPCGHGASSTPCCQPAHYLHAC